MRLHVLSDLHTEYADFDVPKTDAKVVVLAGDIGVGTAAMDWVAQQTLSLPVVYVPGNHEYYGQDINSTDRLAAVAPENVRVLADKDCVIDGVRFLGSTLWTDFKFDGDGEAWFARERAKRLIEDFTAIRNGNRPFTPEDSVDLHRRGLAWLVDQLEKGHEGPTVVVTHHLPAARSVASRYRNDPLNPSFASRLEGIIEKYHPTLWIHGHTHVACDYEIYGTRVVCNPRGYPGESTAKGFTPGLVVKI
jgi:predicted phosphodiesterase